MKCSPFFNTGLCVWFKIACMYIYITYFLSYLAFLTTDSFPKCDHHKFITTLMYSY